MLIYFLTWAGGALLWPSTTTAQTKKTLGAVARVCARGLVVYRRSASASIGYPRLAGKARPLPISIRKCCYVLYTKKENTPKEYLFLLY